MRLEWVGGGRQVPVMEIVSSGRQGGRGLGVLSWLPIPERPRKCECAHSMAAALGLTSL